MDQGPVTYSQAYGQYAVQQVPAYAQPRSVSFQFLGSASEYFKIWAVNTLLTIATLGIYSAWAKVRTKQYFYRNTQVEGASFDYLADPIPILKGRVLVAVVLGLVAWSQYYSPVLYSILIGLLFLVTPWVVVKSLAFNARNSAYRNIRFAFPARVSEAYGAYFVSFVVYAFTCGIGYPWAQWNITKFIVSRHYYGDLSFTWHTKPGAYYRAYLVALALTVPAYVAMFVAIFSMRGIEKAGLQAAMFVIMPIFFGYLLIPAAYLRARVGNLLYNGMMVGNHWFVSSQRTTEVFKLYAVNALAILASLGLLIPWAMIRLAKYRAATLTLQAAGELRATTLLNDDTSAIGEGMADLGDFDLGIGT